MPGRTQRGYLLRKAGVSGDVYSYLFKFKIDYTLKYILNNNSVFRSQTHISFIFIWRKSGKSGMSLAICLHLTAKSVQR